mgnify:CR=1 FL=1
MNAKTLTGHLLTPTGFVRGVLRCQDGRIESLVGQPVSEDEVRGADTPLVLPGFVDLHVHGGGGRDTMEGGDAVAALARLHAQHGTTSLLATTMTAPMAEILQAVKAIGEHCRQPSPSAARVLGVHLEGPFLNEQRLGAQPPFAQAATLNDVLRLHALAPLRLITLAPEVPPHLDLIAPLRAHGFVVQIGHSNGSYEDGVAALRQGASGFTHLFNAMSPLHQRAPGMVGAALAHAQHAEIIPDLLHVHPGAVRAALRAIPCLYCVTDSTAAAGMPDGDYRLGQHTVTKCLGGVRLADGTLAGSTLTMDQALRNLVQALDMSLVEASKRVSTYAADFIGEPQRGRLQVGAFADWVELDHALQVQRVVVEGEDVTRG